MFRSSHFSFLVFGHLVTKIRKYYILQGKMGKTEKKQKENHATKVTKIPKTKRRKYGIHFCPIFKNTHTKSVTTFQIKVLTQLKKLNIQ